MSDDSERDDMSKPSHLAGLWDTIKTVAYALVIALTIRTAAYEPFNIPSGSMIPTLLVGDYLFVSKYPYGYSRFSFDYFGETIGLSKLVGSFGGEERRIWFDPPARGDIAVFKLPRDNSIDYIKRIIGLPGDEIQMIDGVLHINGVAVKRERIEDYVTTDHFGNTQRIAQYTETLPNGVSHQTLDMDPMGRLDSTRVYVVPEGHYFAMGDNRDNSLDSRVTNGVGFVPAENLVGRAEILFYSTDGSAEIWEPWFWFTATRYSRLFQTIN
ncbi:MAG: signal peptidase I [Alphaproteobacteria bacterium]|jgi:signal peptidase I